jgi:hypothetical protein
MKRKTHSRKKHKELRHATNRKRGFLKVAIEFGIIGAVGFAVVKYLILK